MICLSFCEVVTIIVRGVDISHWGGWCQYLDERLQITIKQLSTIL